MNRFTRLKLGRVDLGCKYPPRAQDKVFARSLTPMIVASTYPQDEHIERITRPRTIDSRYFASYNLLFLLRLLLIHNFIQFRDLILTCWRDDDILRFATGRAANGNPPALFQRA